MNKFRTRRHSVSWNTLPKLLHVCQATCVQNTVLGIHQRGEKGFSILLFLLCHYGFRCLSADDGGYLFAKFLILAFQFLHGFLKHFGQDLFALTALFGMSSVSFSVTEIVKVRMWDPKVGTEEECMWRKDLPALFYFFHGQVLFSNQVNVLSLLTQAGMPFWWNCSRSLSEGWSWRDVLILHRVGNGGKRSRRRNMVHRDGPDNAISTQRRSCSRKLTFGDFGEFGWRWHRSVMFLDERCRSFGRRRAISFSGRS